MADEERTAGTLTKDVGDAAEHAPTTGTPAPEDRNADADERWKEALGWKEKAERANQLETEIAERDRRIAELEARREPSPAVADDDEDDDLGPEELSEITTLAAQGYALPKAILRQRKQILKQREEREHLIEALVNRDQLRDIESKDERAAVAAHFQKNRHRGIDINAARAEVREQRLEKENADLRKKVDLLQSKPPPNPDVVRTHERDAPASETKPTSMTQAQWDTEQAQLDAAGNHKEKMRRQIQRRSGKIQVT